MSSPYSKTSSHFRTLGLLGNLKKFESLTLDEVSSYLAYSQHETESSVFEELVDYLQYRFGWDIDSRLAECKTAWADLQGKSLAVSSSSAMPTVSSSQASETDKICSQSIPLTIKSDVCRRHMLACEVNDPNINFIGDSGAIGRLEVDDGSSPPIIVDLKGRQYAGNITSGPTLLFLNLAAPVGHAVNQPVARIEGISNEVCQLQFQKDIMGGINGIYTAEDNRFDAEDGAEIDEPTSSTTTPKTAKKTTKSICSSTGKKAMKASTAVKSSSQKTPSKAGGKKATTPAKPTTPAKAKSATKPLAKKKKLMVVDSDVSSELSSSSAFDDSDDETYGETARRRKR